MKNPAATFIFEGQMADDLIKLSKESDIGSPSETVRHALRLMAFLEAEISQGAVLKHKDSEGTVKLVEFGPLRLASAKGYWLTRA